jgi:G3E family GTPase
MSRERIPLTLITGFLGSGKTTLLAELLRDPLLGDAVVLVNELGEVPLDHHLLREVDEKTVILDSGCVCCTIRTDLVDELRDLEVRVHRGELPAFRRVIVETTGLADPVPVLATLLSDPLLAAHYMADGVVTCVDAVNAPLQAERQPEWTKQVVVADRIVLTKTDLAEADATLAEALIRARNPVAELIIGVGGDVPASRLIGLGVLAEDRRAEQVTAWLDAVDHGHGHAHDHEHDHHAGVHAIALRFDEPLDWTMFALWLAMLLQSRGDDVLRVKGLLDTGAEGPLVLHGVQHVIHPPTHLAAWPDEDHTSRIVLIVRGIGRAEVETSLRAFDRLAKPTSEILA